MGGYGKDVRFRLCDSDLHCGSADKWTNGNGHCGRIRSGRSGRRVLLRMESRTKMTAKPLDHLRHDSTGGFNEGRAPTIDQGVLSTIEKLKEVPLRTVEALLEGLAKRPEDFAIMGLGFVVGYEGIDIMGVLFKPIKDILGNLGDLTKLAGGPIVPQVDLSAIAMAASSVVDLVKLATGPITGDYKTLFGLFPNKHITPASKNPNLLAPGISFYGPAPTGFTGPWPPYGTTLGTLEDQIQNAVPGSGEDWNLRFEQWWVEQKVKIVMGCTGAILAYMVTRPGFVTGIISGIGELTKGVGEIVPL